jgi:membrane associated rhomboid family serine protease
VDEKRNGLPHHRRYVGAVASRPRVRPYDASAVEGSTVNAARARCVLFMKRTLMCFILALAVGLVFAGTPARIALHLAGVLGGAVLAALFIRADLGRQHPPGDFS